VDEPQNDAWEKTVRRDMAVGRTVGEYVIRRRIGEGGMGIVYEAEHPQIGRRVAIKIIRPDREVTRDLLGEARAVSLIRHRHIIDVFGFGELDGLGQYLVMDYLDGVPLDEEIRTRAPLGASEVIAILDDTLAALSAAHAKGVIHRDLKPGNLFLVRESSGTRYVKVLDFGLAKPPPASVPPERRTREGIAMGTPEYMAPEQAQAKAVDGRTDLYAVGIIAFEMLTGRVPFEGDTALAIAMKQVSDRPPRPRARVPSIPPQLEELVLRLLEKNPADRFATAEAVRGELKRIRRDVLAEPTPFGPALHSDELSVRPTELNRVQSPSTIDAPVETPAAKTVVVPDTEPTAPPVASPVPRRAGLPIMLGAAALAIAGTGMFLLAQPRGGQTEVKVEPIVVPPPPPEPAPPDPVPIVPAPADLVQPPQPPVEAVKPPKPALVPARKAQVYFIAHNCSAEIFVDGKSMGHTPRAEPVSVYPGEHTLRLANPLCDPPAYEERVPFSGAQVRTFVRTFKKK